MKNELQSAIDAAKDAGSIIMQYYKSKYEIHDKSYHNPVTTADNAADAFLKETLLTTEINLDRNYLARDLINIIRARTFPPYQGAYIRAGKRKIYMSLKFSVEETDHDLFENNGDMEK